VRAQTDLPRDERRHHVRQAGRRLVCAVLMAVFASMIIGWFFVERLIPRPDPAEIEAGRHPPVIEFVAYYWIAALLVLFALLTIAVVDFVATARYGLQQHRTLAKEHQAILEKEAARLREERQRRDNMYDG
jgi:hypothetical protein